MRYEPINLSDPYTFEAPDDELASGVAALLGLYFAEPVEEASREMPKSPGKDQMYERGEETVAALRSMRLGSRIRSSLNNIGLNAALWATKIEYELAERKREAEVEKEPHA